MNNQQIKLELRVIRGWVKDAQESAKLRGIVEQTPEYKEYIRKRVYQRRHTYIMIREFEERQKREGYRI